MLRLLLSLLGAAAALALAAPVAQAKDFDVPATFAKDIVKAKQRSGIDVLVPQTYADDFVERVYGSSVVRSGEYAFTLAAARRCGAEACFLATFSGERGARPAFKRRIRLTRGVVGYYKPMTCGGSCSPVFVQFKRRGVLYEVQAKASKADVVRMANEMIQTGPR